MNLTQVAFWARRFLKLSLFAFLGLLILHFSWLIVYQSWRRAHPPAPPPPNTAFGTLPRTHFREDKVHPRQFQLETISGQLPTFPNQSRVYFVIAQQSRLLAFDRATNLARRFGFTQPAEKKTNGILVYHQAKSGETFTINPLTQNFEYSYPFEEDQIIMNQLLPPNLDALRQQALSFLHNHISQNLDLKTPGEITFYKLTANGLQEATALAEANIARVSFNRQDLDQRPILPPNLNEPNIAVWLSGNGSRPVVKLKFIHFSIDREKFATYPLLPISQAWQELKNGHYHLARLDKTHFNKGTPIKIHKIYLAYLDPNYPLPFLKPIYVFSGSNHFVGYIEAVSPSFLSD